MRHFNAITASGPPAVQKDPVDTIALLKSSSVSGFSGGETRLVHGYYAAGDGGGGIFRYNASSSATDNGGTILAPNTGSGRWARIYSGALEVRWFGARSDGTTDDTTAVQAVIDLAAAQTGGTVTLPPGTKTRVSGVVMKAGVTLATSITGMHGDAYYLGVGTATIQATSGSTGFVIDTPTTDTTGVAVVGIVVLGAGVLASMGGIRLRHSFGAAIKQVQVDQCIDEGIKIEGTSIGCVVDDVSTVNCVLNRTRSAYIGTLDIDGSDHWIGRVECNTSISALTSTNKYICAIVARGNNHFFEGCIGELSDRGYVILCGESRFSNCRADLNYGDGWYITGGVNSFSTCQAISNGNGTTNTHDGFVVDGAYGNTFASCSVFSNTGSTVRYAFNDNTGGAGFWQRSHYVACHAISYSTASFFTQGFVGSAPLWAPHPVRIADATAIPDVTETSFILFSDYTTPTTVTNFSNATAGQTVRMLGKSVVTVANNANIQTSTAANKVLVDNAIYEFTFYNGKWYESSSVLDSSGGLTATSLTASGQLAGSTGILNYGAALGYGMAVQANANVTPVTVAAAVSTAQNLMSYAVPAGLLNVVGRTLRVKGSGLYSTQATAPNITLTLTLGGTTIATFGAATAISSTTSAPWSFEVLIGTVSTGASGTLEVHGEFKPRLSTAAGALSVFADNNTAVSGAIDLTTSETLQVQWTYSNASTSNSVTQRQMHALLSG